MNMPDMITANVAIIALGLLLFAMFNFIYSCSTEPGEMELCTSAGGSWIMVQEETDENYANYECQMP